MKKCNKRENIKKSLLSYNFKINRKKKKFEKNIFLINNFNPLFKIFDFIFKFYK